MQCFTIVTKTKNLFQGGCPVELEKLSFWARCGGSRDAETTAVVKAVVEAVGSLLRATLVGLVAPLGGGADAGTPYDATAVLSCLLPFFNLGHVRALGHSAHA